jgi:hypothetical protein
MQEEKKQHMKLVSFNTKILQPKPTMEGLERGATIVLLFLFLFH